MRLKVYFINVIKFYQKYISPYKGTKCPYFPSCSQYGIESLERFGIIKGTFLTISRIIRCNPFSKGGIDPVPETENNYHILKRI